MTVSCERIRSTTGFQARVIGFWSCLWPKVRAVTKSAACGIGATRLFGRRYDMLQPWFVLEFIFSILSALRVFFRSRSDTALEILALRQQVAVLKRKRPRPPLHSLDRLLWTLLHRY